MEHSKRKRTSSRAAITSLAVASHGDSEVQKREMPFRLGAQRKPPNGYLPPSHGSHLQHPSHLAMSNGGLGGNALNLLPKAQPNYQHAKLMLEEQHKQEEKKRLKRAANRKSACTSRARKKQYVQDMTRANQSLKQHAQIMDLLPDLIIGVDRHGIVHYVSRSVLGRLQYPISTIIGASFFDLCTPDTASTARSMLQYNGPIKHWQHRQHGATGSEGSLSTTSAISNSNSGSSVHGSNDSSGNSSPDAESSSALAPAATTVAVIGSPARKNDDRVTSTFPSRRRCSKQSISRAAAAVSVNRENASRSGGGVSGSGSNVSKLDGGPGSRSRGIGGAGNNIRLKDSNGSEEVSYSGMLSTSAGSNSANISDDGCEKVSMSKAQSSSSSFLVPSSASETHRSFATAPSSLSATSLSSSSSSSSSSTSLAPAPATAVAAVAGRAVAFSLSSVAPVLSLSAVAAATVPIQRQELAVMTDSESGRGPAMVFSSHSSNGGNGNSPSSQSPERNDKDNESTTAIPSPAAAAPASTTSDWTFSEIAESSAVGSCQGPPSTSSNYSTGSQGLGQSPRYPKDAGNSSNGNSPLNESSTINGSGSERSSDKNSNLEKGTGKNDEILPSPMSGSSDGHGASSRSSPIPTNSSSNGSGTDSLSESSDTREEEPQSQQLGNAGEATSIGQQMSEKGFAVARSTENEDKVGNGNEDKSSPSSSLNGSAPPTFAAWSILNLKRHNEEIDQLNEQSIWKLCLVRRDRSTLMYVEYLWFRFHPIALFLFLLKFWC